MQGVQIFEFDNEGLLRLTTQAPISLLLAKPTYPSRQATRIEFSAAGNVPKP
jgi:hypothetical protein